MYAPMKIVQVIKNDEMSFVDNLLKLIIFANAIKLCFTVATLDRSRFAAFYMCFVGIIITIYAIHFPGRDLYFYLYSIYIIHVVVIINSKPANGYF